MGDVIRFVSKPDHGRARLVRQARAIYDSIFPATDPVDKQQERGLERLATSSAQGHRSDRKPLS